MEEGAFVWQHAGPSAAVVTVAGRGEGEGEESGGGEEEEEPRCWYLYLRVARSIRYGSMSTPTQNNSDGGVLFDDDHA